MSNSCVVVQQRALWVSKKDKDMKKKKKKGATDLDVHVPPAYFRREEALLKSLRRG